MHPLRRAMFAVSVTALVTGCGSAATKDASTAKISNPDIVVGAIANEGSAGLYIAQEQGLFRKAGLNVTVKTITSAATALPDLLHGSVDVVDAQYTTFITAQAKGIGQFRVLAPGWNLGPDVEAIVTRQHSPISTVPQLRGKTIAVNAIDGIDQFITEQVLQISGMKSSAVHFVAIPFQVMATALAAHRVDAAYLSEPYLTEAEQKYGVQTIADVNNGATAGLPVSGYVALKSWALKNRAAAKAFGKAIAEGNVQAMTSRAAFERAMEKQLRLTSLVADTMGTGDFPTGINDVTLQRDADLLFDFGALHARFQVRPMLP